MCRGTYLHRGADGLPLAVEQFTAVAEPAGWRYTGVFRVLPDNREAGGIDVTADTTWRELNVRLRGPSGQFRGRLRAGRAEWRIGASADDAGASPTCSAQVDGFIGGSAGLLVPCARALRLAVGGAAEATYVELSWPSLAVRLVARRWRLVAARSQHAGEQRLAVQRYTIADPDAAAAPLDLAGDLVLDGPGLALTDVGWPPDARGERPKRS